MKICLYPLFPSCGLRRLSMRKIPYQSFKKIQVNYLFHFSVILNRWCTLSKLTHYILPKWIRRFTLPPLHFAHSSLVPSGPQVAKLCFPWSCISYGEILSWLYLVHISGNVLRKVRSASDTSLQRGLGKSISLTLKLCAEACSFPLDIPLYICTVCSTWKLARPQFYTLRWKIRWTQHITLDTMGSHNV